jgi:hypothetical protein
LVGLIVDADVKITKPVPVPTGSHALHVAIEPVETGSSIWWSVLFGQDFPEVGAFLVEDGKVRKLGSKSNAQRGTVWTGNAVKA